MVIAKAREQRAAPSVAHALSGVRREAGRSRGDGARRDPHIAQSPRNVALANQQFTLSL
jgi:hypothetical protein